MFKLLLKLAPALQAGQELKSVEGWKNTQVTVNCIVAVLGLVVAAIRMQWPDFMVSDEQLLTVATGVASILAGVNGYLTVATSKKIGISEPKGK